MASNKSQPTVAAESPPSVDKATKPSELLPIDYLNSFCPNCSDRLHYDYESNKNVCPALLKNCPQNE
jgi:hypothetical protein